jgi:hypothetical protein
VRHSSGARRRSCLDTQLRLTSVLSTGMLEASRALA